MSGRKAIFPSRLWCTSKVMLKSSMTRPGGLRSMWASTLVRYMLAKPGTIAVTLVRRQVWAYLIHCITAYSRVRYATRSRPIRVSSCGRQLVLA